MKKLTENQRRHVGETLTIRWGTSKGRDTYGYTTCSLRNHRGQKVAACNGGGYDMRGTVIGNWIAATFPKELCALEPADMPEHSRWERSDNRYCASKCKATYTAALEAAIVADNVEAFEKSVTLEAFARDVFECPNCGGETETHWGEGQRIDEGRYFYGLRFVDPKYNPLDAKLENADGLFTNADDVGKTFRQLQDEGKIVDLDVLRTWYQATSPYPTERHTRPTIDGACGESSVLTILRGIGLGLRRIHGTGKVDIYEITKAD